MADPVLALQDEIGGGERCVRVASGELVGREHVPRLEGIEDRREALGPRADGAAGGPQGRPIRGCQQRQRLGVVLDLAADRHEDRLVGLDGADHVVARDVRSRHNDDG